MPTPKEVLPPDFQIVRFNDTAQWSGELVAKLKGGKIWGVYLFDKNQVTHCAEVTPSYCLYWIRDEGEMGDGTQVGDELDEDIRAGGVDTEAISYMHCHRVDKLPDDRFQKIEHQEAYDPAKHESAEKWYADELELALDYARCNS